PCPGITEIAVRELAKLLSGNCRNTQSDNWRAKRSATSSRQSRLYPALNQVRNIFYLAAKVAA
ncbi:hypothetical protein ACVSQB_40965, partial [Bradyrhizobium elkanii]